MIFPKPWESYLKSSRLDMPRNWCDSNNIIFICYYGGAGGYAMRYLLGLSPGTDVRTDTNRKLRGDGAAHYMLDRNSIHLKSNLNQTLNLETWPDGKGHAVWSDRMDQNLVKKARQELYHATDQDGIPLNDMIDYQKMVMVDHLPSRSIREFFPNAIVLYLNRNINTSIRNYAMKNMLQSPANDQFTFPGLEHVATTLQARLVQQDIPLSKANYKHELRTFRNLTLSKIRNIGDDMHVIDGDRIFDPAHWPTEYYRVLDICKLEPNTKAADRFIRQYHSLQYDRLNNPQSELISRLY